MTVGKKRRDRFHRPFTRYLRLSVPYSQHHVDEGGALKSMWLQNAAECRAKEEDFLNPEAGLKAGVKGMQR